jgi:hypothetical protein
VRSHSRNAPDDQLNGADGRLTRVALGVQASPFMGLPRGSSSWDEELARLALSRLTSGIKGKSR